MPLPDSRSLLITGPAASGKSRAALEHFRAVDGSLVVVPTATMAEHLRHQMTRDGESVRPSRVRTFAQFLEDHSTLTAPPPHLLHLLIQQALERQRPARFQAVAEFEGLHAAMVELFEEAPASALPGDLADLLEHVERELLERGMGLRRQRLAEAAQGQWHRLQLVAVVVFDGFFTFSDSETRLLAALSHQTRVILTLPDWPASARARESLVQAGFEERRLSATFRASRQAVFSAATVEREAEEIARRILAMHSAGRDFRDLGIVLRARDPYAPLLATTLARFGIPARSYFSDPLDQHSAVAFLLGVLRSLLAGWDHATLLETLRMPVSGIGATPAGDRLDFEWREELPGRGLPLPDRGVGFSLQRRLQPPPRPSGNSDRGLKSPLQAEARSTALTAMELWRRERVSAGEWAERFKSLRTLVSTPRIEDRVSRLQADAWRSTAAALEAFGEVMDQAVAALGPGPISLGSFGNLARLALRLAPLRVPDRRRDVVHIMDVFEARQWELPVVFVCGLTERHFPQYHREDPLLGDAARSKAGLDTVASRQAQERSLFEFAISRATEEVILSYPRFDEKGEDTLRSFFLDRDGDAVEGGVRPRPLRAVAAAAPAPIQDEALRQSLAERHGRLSPSSIETFAQCPFKFFAQKTLRLHERPAAPRDRLDIRLQGSIMHRALAEWVRSPLLGAAIFDQVFAEECAHRRIPPDYRTEAVRLEMLRNFAAFIAGPQARLPGWESRTEQEFEFAFYPGLSIRGRIDRLEQNARGEALVIDYKYSAKDKLRERVGRSEEGQEVQTGIYLLAAERQFALRPVGMLFCGLKKGIAWEGWHLPVEGFEDAGNTCNPEALRSLITTAEQTAIDAHGHILSGRIAAQPADTDHCRYCDFRDACRVETLAAARGAGS
ncbi:MAG TPA: PD-(D/E)XK nuclease family protein [Bryobacteraceae bacterium]|nr:PD-(D/E)XK nuclease family protein [Bryobacteraceae bacterium]